MCICVGLFPAVDEYIFVALKSIYDTKKIQYEGLNQNNDDNKKNTTRLIQ